MTELPSPFVAAIPLAESLPPALGLGAFLKSTLCLIHDRTAYLTADYGDLDNVERLRAYHDAVAAVVAQAGRWGIAVEDLAVAHDLHPDFASTHQARRLHPNPIAVQHHHAHLGALAAEHGVTEPMLCLAMDGYGMGEANPPNSPLGSDAWGGELLWGAKGTYRRLGRLRPLRQPGGDRAAREPWRMGAAALYALGMQDRIANRFAAFPQAAQLGVLLARGLNAPETSSCGRLFDAACGLLDVIPVAEFEGQAPMRLEAMSKEHGSLADEAQPDLWSVADSEIFTAGELDCYSLLSRIALTFDRDTVALSAQEKSKKQAELGALFHRQLASGLAAWALAAAEQEDISVIGMGGGCFLNSILRNTVEKLIQESGRRAVLPNRVSAGDQAISLGQAWIAAQQRL